MNMKDVLCVWCLYVKFDERLVRRGVIGHRLPTCDVLLVELMAVSI